MMAYKEGADTLGVVEWAKSLKTNHRGPLPTVKKAPYNRYRWEGRGREGQEGDTDGRGEEVVEKEKGKEMEGGESDGVAGDGVNGDGVNGDGVSGDGVEDEGVENEGVENEGVEDEGVEDERVEDEGVEDLGVEDEGVEDEGGESERGGGLQGTDREKEGVELAEEEQDYSEERKAAFLTTVFHYLRRSQAKPDGKWELFFHLDTFLDFLISDGAAFSEVPRDTN